MTHTHTHTQLLG